MILVDTSVWVEHLRTGSARLAALLEQAQVLMHPFVVGELACGSLENRDEVIRLLEGLPQAVTVRDHEALYFIDQHRLMGRGIGYIDVHLLTATALSGPARLWTLDRRLAKVASDLGLAWQA